ncbi:amino acid adenylation domain-containing protein [Azospirillum agricola]|uniref:non-ribosomal peptide synthetase/type I polyketide synthase n=1 Tax=Azospirillum agricola TaxID=1720247 RepID=UPI001AE98061|nr:non-ribosomal peptide synthetase/type I polyketide synthase [Azospirillum agricola]MBP2227690.1 amino acid adenylation domain-containing protein [Azospirillum agricola]
MMDCSTPNRIPSTLAAALEESATTSRGVTYVLSSSEERRLPYAGLLDRARRWLGRLQDQGVREGDELVLATDDQELFTAVFWACILGRIVAVPVSTPTNDEGVVKILNVLDALDSPWLLSDQPLEPRLAAGGHGADTLARMAGRIIAAPAATLDGRLAEPAAVAADDVALIQFSSGSTGTPKGVTLAHANLLANVRAIMDHLGPVGAEGRLLNWMPLTHDFGIIWFHIMPVVFALDHAMIPTKLFIRNPLIWMQKTSDFRASILGGPNYSYRHLLKHLDPAGGGEGAGELGGEGGAARGWDLSCVRVVVNGAEPIACDLIADFQRAMAPYGLAPGAMMPAYGLAEGTLCVCLTPVGAGLRAHAVDRRTVSAGMRVRPDDAPGSLDRIVFADVGVPVATVGLRIADAQGEPCPDGVVGTIQIRGPSVMRGYRNNPEATAAVLSGDGWLDTGDLGYLRDGRLVVTGRRKDVVILNGANYYPQDIERVAAEVPGLDLNMVLACAVPLPGEGREGLALCILFRKSLEAFAPLAEQVRDQVVRKIGIPVDHCLAVPRIPKTTSGKVRRFHLVERFAAGAFDEQIATLRRLAGERGAALREARSSGDRAALLAALAALAARLTPSGAVDPDAPLMEQGLTSLRLVEFLNRVNHALEVVLPVSVLFDHPTLAGLAGHLMGVPLDGGHAATGPEPEPSSTPLPVPTPASAGDGAIAVVGIGCRFPGGADGPDAFWERLAAGSDATGPFPADRWPAALNAGATTDRGAYLDRLDRFDARFFNLTPVEAEALDPQQRLLLTVSWEAFEHAGIDPHGLRGAPVGVFTGISGSDYAQAQARGALDGIGAYAFTGTAPSVASGRLSFFHGFAGPNLAVDTACSSSLAAVHLAVRALRAGDCGLALAAGVNLILAPELQVGLSRMNALSPDGRCKSFDAAADGYARGEGCGAVLLKRLDDARRDGDRVLAVIRGSAMNHDGASNGLTAPSGAAQQAVLRAALADAGLEPGGIDYVEAHGTGTALGDPVEVMALAGVQNRERPADRPLLVGSVKSNIAHLEAAAGIAALCKTVLALERGLLPASLHLRTPNPRIPWTTIPVEVVAAARPWPDTPGGRPRRAGVSAFGMSGTNVHVIVEAAPAAGTAITDPVAGSTPPPALIALSARTEDDLAALAHRYGDALRGADAERLHDLAHTAALGRAAFPHRLSVAGREAGTLVDRLAASVPRNREPASPAPRVVFAFSGQGSQMPGAGRELFEREPVFRDSLLRAERTLGDRLGRTLTELMFAGTAGDLARTAVTQPAVVAFGLALAELLRSWGVVPAAVLGHSVGEIAAAAVAGVCDPDTALLMAARRGALMQALPPGAMAAAACDPATAEAALAQAGGVGCVAAVNGPASVTLSGESAAVERAVAILQGRGVRTSRLDVSHAFHSPLMDPILADLEGMARERPLGEPRVPFHSTVTGGRAGAGLLSDPAYWARHARAPVRFHEALQGVPVDAATVFVELGARPGLAPLAAASLPEATWLACAGGPDPALRLDETLGRLFELGVPVSWPAVFSTRPGRRTTAPTYPFQGRTRLLPTVRTGAPVAAVSSAPTLNAPTLNAIVATAAPMTPTGTSSRRDGIAATIRGILKGIAGLDPAEVAPSASWFSLGLDSLLIVQLQQALSREYAVELALADVLEHGSTLDALSALVETRLPPPAHPEPGASPSPAMAVAPTPAPAPAPAPTSAPVPGVEGVLSRQIEAMSALFQQQLAVLQGAPTAAPAAPAAPAASAAAPAAPPPAAVAPPARTAPEIKGLFKKLPGKRDGWNEAQAAHVRRLAVDYNARTSGSKEHTDRHRDVYANPRAVIGFRPEWKELTYPLHVDRAEGAYVWDVDGNRYVDITMGFGVTLLGHNPPFVREAVAAELAAGAPLGPQTARAGTVARLLAEMTGAERVAFFTTGSEAVMVAVRLARAVTGRTKIVLFVNSYHGTFDGVLAVGWADGGRVTSMPVTDGTPQRMVDDVIVLRYGDPAALDVIRAHAGELAAVLVEPVQSRDPAVQPREFLHELRALTTDKDIALIFDEMIMGFRIHPGGAQHHFGVTADLATYGKIVGGGMPVGVVAGRKRFMDAVDGGLWRYGDDSAPSARTAFVAGTFNNHPLAMAAAEAMLRHLKEAGPGLQQTLNARTAAMAADLNALFEAEEVPVRVVHFGSLFRFDFAADTEILNYHLLKNGVFVWEGRNCFLSTAHSDADIAFIVEAVRRSVAEMRDGGWLPPRGGGRAHAPASGASAMAAPAGAPALERTPMPVGRGQQEMWFLIQSRPEATLAYNEMVALDLRGPLDVAALRRALDALAARHPALRATALDGEGWRAAPPAPVPLPAHPVADAAAVTAWLAADLGRPFDLKAGPLLRAALLRRGDGHHALALTVHHIVADGWSLGLMVSELSALYAAERHGRPAALPPAQPFDAFVAWSAALPQQPPAPAAESAPPVLLPREDAHARTPSFRGGRIHRREPAGPSGPLYGRVRALARAQDASPVMVLLAGFALLLGRLADQRRFTVGLPVAGHTEAGMPDMVGAASAVLPLAVTLDPGESFAALLQRVKADLTAAQRDIRRLFRREPDGPAPAINVLFNVDRGVRMGFDGLEADWLSPPVAHPKMDLFLNVLELNGEALFDFDHDSAVAGPATAARWFDSLVALLDRAAADPQAPLRSLPLSPADEKAIQAAEASGIRTLDGFGAPAAIGVVAPVERRMGGGWSDSGELGRLRPDGTVEVLGSAGRLLRGARGWIDLGTVEAALAEHPAVTRAVVVLEEAGLTAFTDGKVPAGVLAAFLRARLPADHVPSFFAALPAGPADADALRAGDAERVRGREIVAPRTPEEARVAAVWSSVLGLTELGVTESFFDLGGHSLKALAILARVAREFGRSVPLRRFFEAPTVAGLARLLTAGATDDAAPIPRLPEAPDYAPSNAQARLWMLEQIDPGLTAYNIGFALVSGTGVDEPALRRALDRLARRHESLRTALVERDGLPRQIVEADPAPVLTVEKVDGEDAARSRARAIVAAPFDLGRAPLWRVALLTGEEGAGAWIVAVMHHAIGDVWSVGVFIRDLLALYGQERDGGPILPLAELPELPVQYRDCAAWQAERQDTHLPFWRQRLDGAPPVLELPADRPRPPVKTYDGDQVTVTVPAATAAALRALAAARDASPFMAVTAGLYGLLHRVTGHGDLLIGGVGAGRDHPALEDAIGFFVNTLPLRTAVAPSDRFLDLLDRARATMLEAFEHGDTPFDRIVEAVGAPRDPARNPLFEIVLVMDDREGILRLLEGTGWRAEEIDTATAQFDLTLYVTDRPDGIAIKAAYNTNLFDRARIERLMVGFAALLTAAAAEPERPLIELAAAGLAVTGPANTGVVAAEPSPHQERLWFVDRFERGVLYPQGPTYYNMPVVARLTAAPDPARLETALARLAARHPALRTALATEIAAEGERPVLRVAENAALPLARIAAPAGGGLEAVETASREPFDLSRAPLVRASLCVEDGGAVFLALTAHHAVADKRALHRLLDELAALCANPGAVLPALAEPAAAAESREADSAFWRASLDGLTALVLPTDRPRPAIHTYTAGRTALTLDAVTTSAIAALARRLGDGATAAFSVTDALRALWLGLLHRLSGQADVVIGEPFEPAGDLTAGPHANLLTLRADLDAAPGFADLLRQSAGRRRAAEAHAAMPFDHVVLAIKPKNDMSRTALFDVLFHHDAGGAPALAAAGGRIVDTGLGWGKYDLVLSLRDADGGTLDATLVYNRDLFDDAGARRILERFRRLAVTATAAPETPLADLDLMVEGERESLLTRAAQVAGYPRHLTIQTAFEAAAERHGDRIAVTDGDRSLTYAALNAQANRLARALRAHGVGPDRLAGVYLDRTIALPVAFLGILKAGGAYVPMDPDYPAERVRFMVGDSGAEVIVTDAAHAGEAARFGRPVLLVDQPEGPGDNASGDNPAPAAGPENLAYVIYTSGSTGVPKGVMVEHRNLVQLMFHDRHPFAFGPEDVWTLFHSPCFDFSVWEMYGALLHGGRLVVVPKRVAQDAAAFLDCLSREGVTVLNQTPTAFHSLIDAALAHPDPALRLREVIFGGEALQPARLADWHRRHPETRLVNMYGITETTVHVTFKTIGADEIAAGRSVIGAPLPSYGVLLVDPALRPLPVGVTGEILVTGHGVARGYLNRPELTAERFIEHPALPGQRLYRSGDLGRMTEDGELVYLGRLDHQVKIRGFRIELGEIERQLLAHAGIRDAVVLPDGDSLSAYLAAEPGSVLSREDIVHHLSDKLPDYMVPSRLLGVEAIPLTANGKIDRAALAAAGRPLAGGGGGVADEPRTPVQRTVAAIWREVLGVGRVGLRDNFFELGGHSLKANQAVVRIRRQLDRPLTLKDFFSAQTLGALADLLAARGTEEDRRIAPAPPPAASADGYPLSFAQRRLCLLQSMEPDLVSYNMVGGFLLDGPLRLDALAHAFEALVVRHEVLRTRFVTRHGQARQVIDPPPNGFILETEDRSRDGGAGTDAVIDDALKAELRHVFDLGTGPLLRVRVVELPREPEGRHSHALLLNMHHVVSDGWSVTVMLRELEALYRAALADPARTGAALAATLPPLPLQYKDYAAWQTAEAAGPGLAAARRFWLGLFEDRVPVLALPTDRPRPERAGGDGAIVHARLDRPLTAALNALARAHDTTLFVVLAALVRAQLHLVSGDGDIVLGTPVAGRTQVELEGLIGFHLNLLPLRLGLSPGQSFAGLLAAERALALDAFTHQSYPFDRLVEELDPPRLPGRQPLFDVLVILQNNEPLRLELPEITARPIRDVSVSAKYDLNFMFEDRPEIELALEYAADLFDPQTAERLAGAFVALAHRAVADPGATLATLGGGDATASPNQAQPATALPDGSGDDELMDAW